MCVLFISWIIIWISCGRVLTFLWCWTCVRVGGGVLVGQLMGDGGEKIQGKDGASVCVCGFDLEHGFWVGCGAWRTSWGWMRGIHMNGGPCLEVHPPWAFAAAAAPPSAAHCADHQSAWLMAPLLFFISLFLYCCCSSHPISSLSRTTVAFLKYLFNKHQSHHFQPLDIYKYVYKTTYDNIIYMVSYPQDMISCPWEELFKLIFKDNWTAFFFLLFFST